MTDFPGSVPDASLIVNRAVVEAFPGLSWSPDSGWLTFSGLTPTEGSPIDLYIVDRAGTSLRLLVRDEPGWAVYDPVFSPIGDEIAYTRNGWSSGGSRVPEDGLYVVGLANPAERYQLASTDGEEVNPAWTADGELVSQSRFDDSGCHCYTSDFWVVRSDGRGLRQLDIPFYVEGLAVSPGYTVQIPGASRVETAVNVSKASHDGATG